MKTIYKTLLRSISSAALISLALLFVITSSVARAQWNNNTLVNILISSYNVADMQQAATTDGKTWIAFYHENAGNYDMCAQLIDQYGYKLLGPDGILVGNHPSGSATFVFNACVDNDNNFIIAYQDMRSGDMTAVAYKMDQSGNQLWGADGIVLGGGLAPYPAALSNNEVVIAWIETMSNTLKLQKITTGGTAAWATPVPITVGSTKTTRGQVLANKDGKFSVVFQKNGTGIYTSLYAQGFDNSGTALYAPLQLSTLTTMAARYYSVRAEEDTVYVGYYASQGMRFNAYLQRVNPNGTIPWGMNGSNFNTSTGTNDNYQMETRINLTPGSPYVWATCNLCDPNQTLYGVYIQKFTKSAGARQFGNTGKVVYGISGNRDQQEGELALVFDTPMFMSENSVYKLFATRLDSVGSFVWPGNRIELSSTTATAGTPKMRYCFTPDGPNRCAGTWTENRGMGYKGYAQGISIGGLIGVDVTTQGGVPAVITTDQGTLQLVATVYPASANQNVTWSIIPGTGMATISGSGLVTAISSGTVYAKATAVQDTSVFDTLMITMSNQTAVPPAVVTLDATDILTYTATLNGTVNANNLLTDVSFDWGLTTQYTNTIVADPATVNGNIATPVSAALTGLQPYTTYHFRVKGTSIAGTAMGEDLTFTTSPVAGIGEKDACKVEISPVPNDGRFSLTLSASAEKSFSIEVYNGLGSMVFSKTNIAVNGSLAMDIDLRPVSAGLYTVVVRSSDSKLVRKVMVK